MVASYAAANSSYTTVIGTILEEMRERLDHWMVATDDPLLHGPVRAPHGAELNDPGQVSASYPTRFV